MKSYKALPTDITINNIRNILNNNGIFIKETPYQFSKNFHAVRIAIGSNDLDELNIGTNGKGVSYQYSLASGYGEFMERIQNYMIFKGFRNASKYALKDLPEDSLYRKKLEEHDLVLDFQYDPNEQVFTIEKYMNENSDFLFEIFPFFKSLNDLKSYLIEDLNYKELICIPFYSCSKKKEIFLPIELLLSVIGSNGMAGGNSKAEALIQGFCEIFERYAGYNIYHNNLTPPTIPLDYFKGRPIYDLLNSVIRETSLKIIVKDCSLGMNIPTVGVLIIDEENGKYNFNLGSALNPDIAIERCLTELHQSADGIRWHNIKLDNFSNNPEYTAEYIYINGIKLFLDGAGNWPGSLFNNRPSYEFENLNYDLNKSDEEDYDFIKSLIEELGFNIYIRDVSFLGFNSYYIVIPGMSSFSSKKEHNTILNKFFDKLHSIRNIKKLDESEIIDMCNALNENYHNMKQYNFNFRDLMVYNINEDINDLDLELLLFMLNYRISKFESALFYIIEFLKDKSFCQYKYYFGIADYLKCRIRGLSNDEIKDTIFLKYPDDTEEIIEDLEYPEKILNNYDWPSCFDCEKCQIQADCRQLNFLHIMKKVQEAHIKSLINHNSFIF